MEGTNDCYNGPVHLKPFFHQVGGHTSVFKFDDHTICKLLTPREHHFYENLSMEMVEFTPKYKGSLEVEIHEDEDGYLSLIAHPSDIDKHNTGSDDSDGDGAHTPISSSEEKSDSDLEQMRRPRSNRSPKNDEIRIRLKQSGSIDIESDHSEIIELLAHDPKEAIKITGKKHNPWSLGIFKNTMAKMKKRPDKTCKIILLEDMTSKFAYPCILDLKMGTRVHGDEDNEQKQKRKMAKCAASTSASLGLRVSGMQVYQISSRQFMYHNKYYGRTLTADVFKETLCKFLHNGQKLRKDLVDPILDRLKHFHLVLSKQHTFRFYSSSLLIMYDGKETRIQQAPTVSPKRSTSFDDRETLTALSTSNENLTRQSKSLDRIGKSSRSSSQERPCSPSSSTLSTDPSSTPSSTLSTDQQKSSCKVDVRMIDFAHTTYKGYRDDPQHKGPDKGYMFGLENLIKLFEAIKDDI